MMGGKLRWEKLTDNMHEQVTGEMYTLAYILLE